LTSGSILQWKSTSENNFGGVIYVASLKWLKGIFGIFGGAEEILGDAGRKPPR